MSEPKIVDVFEHWLQGRINLSVTGLLDRVVFLEGKVDGMSERIDQLQKRLSENEETTGVMRRADFGELFSQTIDEYWNNTNIADVVDDDHVWDMIDRRVADAIDEKIEEAGTGMDDETLEDKVKDIITNLSFDVTVS